MESVKLSPRLETIADMVPSEARLADVGTDHALVPIRLILDGRIPSAIASDIRPGPLQRARSNASEYGAENIRFVLCDGLSGIAPDEADAIVIAGMGGETIASILDAAAWARDGKSLILQPMSRSEVLRRELARQGIRIVEERLLEERGKIYTVIGARGGEPLDLSEAEYYTGPYALLSRHPLFPRLTERLIDKFRAALEGLSRSGEREGSGRRERLRTVYGELLRMRGQLSEMSGF